MTNDVRLLDLWWRLFWVWKLGWISCLYVSSPPYNEFLRFTFGVNLWIASIVAESAIEFMDTLNSIHNSDYCEFLQKKLRNNFRTYVIASFFIWWHKDINFSNISPTCLCLLWNETKHDFSEFETGHSSTYSDDVSKLWAISSSPSSRDGSSWFCSEVKHGGTWSNRAAFRTTVRVESSILIILVTDNDIILALFCPNNGLTCVFNDFFSVIIICRYLEHVFLLRDVMSRA